MLLDVDDDKLLDDELLDEDDDDLLDLDDELLDPFFFSWDKADFDVLLPLWWSLTSSSFFSLSSSDGVDDDEDRCDGQCNSI